MCKFTEEKSCFKSCYAVIFESIDTCLKLKEGFFKHLGDVTTVLLDFFLFLHQIPDGLNDGEIRSCC